MTTFTVKRALTAAEKGLKREREEQNYYIIGDPIPMGKWQKILENQDAFGAQKERELHHARCRDCPMYQLIHGPNETLEFRDSSTNEVVRRISFVDRILQVAVEIVRRRLPTLEDMPAVDRVLNRIASTELDDAHLKIFVLCFLIQWFPHVKSFFLSLYPNDTERAKRCKKNFEALVPHLKRWCYGVTISRFNVATVDGIMHTFLYRDLIPEFANGILPVGTPRYEDDMRAKKADIKRREEQQKQRREMLRLRKKALRSAY